MDSNEDKVPGFVSVIAAVVGVSIALGILKMAGINGYLVSAVAVGVTVVITNMIGIALYKSITKS